MESIDYILNSSSKPAVSLKTFFHIEPVVIAGSHKQARAPAIFRAL